ncbi:hypothetical protein CIPAW_09G201700 [Carya illinoinensis]|uniref:Uncharacterized protein n=1 Tax=Carya illinoinensis TaxID=32201 RepID=A0A8T1PFF9_CARIL|nr:hypothetical protein CIPAW_09G201700 [Carya illinoinensis]
MKAAKLQEIKNGKNFHGVPSQYRDTFWNGAHFIGSIVGIRTTSLFVFCCFSFVVGREFLVDR